MIRGQNTQVESPYGLKWFKVISITLNTFALEEKCQFMILICNYKIFATNIYN
jgi:hypothetical protein